MPFTKSNIVLTLALICISVKPLNAQSDQSQTGKHDSLKTIVKTKVLVLGTPHLSHISKKFTPHFVDSLLSVLKAYRPDIIAIEALSGAQIAEMKRRGETYALVAKTFAGDEIKYGQKLQQHSDISWTKANMAADSLLEKFQNPKKITNRARLKLINYLLTSYRLHTAALQWSYLSKKSKANQSVIPADIATALNELLHSADETASISLRLAHHLGLQRVYPIDDHMDMDEQIKIKSRLEAVLDKSTGQKIKNAAYFQRYENFMKRGMKNQNLFPVYKFMNSPAYFDQDKKIQWRETFLQSNFNEALRKRLALWEVRNLNIAAHIRKASTHAIGGHVLVVIGASHKSFLDTYLKDMMGMEIINLKSMAGK